MIRGEKKLVSKRKNDNQTVGNVFIGTMIPERKKLVLKRNLTRLVRDMFISRISPVYFGGAYKILLNCFQVNEARYY
jgi:hypothetical protein